MLSNGSPVRDKIKNLIDLFMKKTTILFLQLLYLFSVFSNEPYRQVLNKDPAGYSIELDDGSVWKVIYRSTASAKNFFQQGDYVIIYPVIYPLFSGSKYYFYNERNGRSVNVDLSLGSISSRGGNLQILQIDYYQGKILLVDGHGKQAGWKVDPEDILLLRTWKVGQNVIIGSNKRYAGLIGSAYEFILINSERDHFIRVNMI